MLALPGVSWRVGRSSPRRPLLSSTSLGHGPRSLKRKTNRGVGPIPATRLAGNTAVSSDLVLPIRALPFRGYGASGPPRDPFAPRAFHALCSRHPTSSDPFGAVSRTSHLRRAAPALTRHVSPKVGCLPGHFFQPTLAVPRLLPSPRPVHGRGLWFGSSSPRVAVPGHGAQFPLRDPSAPRAFHAPCSRHPTRYNPFGAASRTSHHPRVPNAYHLTRRVSPEVGCLPGHSFQFHVGRPGAPLRRSFSPLARGPTIRSSSRPPLVARRVHVSSQGRRFAAAHCSHFREYHGVSGGRRRGGRCLAPLR